MRAGRLVHDGTIRRVSGVGLSPRDGSVPNNAATAEAFFRFVASRMSSAVDSEGLLSDYRSIIGVDPDADDSSAASTRSNPWSRRITCSTLELEIVLELL